VVDIRTPEDREEWSITESVYVNAYERLKAGDVNALAGVDVPADRPVVTICSGQGSAT
jgi:rhodanese-related sulfurtransferase